MYDFYLGGKDEIMADEEGYLHLLKECFLVGLILFQILNLLQYIDYYLNIVERKILFYVRRVYLKLKVLTRRKNCGM